MRWDSIPWRDRLLGAFVYPRLTARIVGDWFRQVTVLPGDEREDFCRALSLRVVAVKPGVVVCEARTPQAVHHGLPAERCAYVRRPVGFWI